MMRRLAPVACLLACFLLADCQAPSAVHEAAVAAKAQGGEGHGQRILIVHGAWGGGWAFREVDTLLTADGYKVYRPTLTGQGERVHLSTPNIDLSLHIQDIVNVILFEDLHDVVLVGHSYGGMVITGVADRVPDRIRKLIYVDALLPENGESANSLLPAPIGRVEADGYIHPTWPVPPNPPHDVLMPAKTFAEPIKLEHAAAVAKIPAAYVLTADAGKRPEDDTFYKFYLRAKSRGWPVSMMEADHNAQWSRPQELVRMLEQNAR